MNRVEVIAGVASELTATEQAIDTAIAQATGYVQAMIAARGELSLSATAGSAAQARALEAIAALGQAREAIVASHGEMAKTHRRLGYGVYAAGPMNKEPDEDGKLVEPARQRHLRLA